MRPVQNSQIHLKLFRNEKKNTWTLNWRGGFVGAKFTNPSKFEFTITDHWWRINAIWDSKSTQWCYIIHIHPKNDNVCPKLRLEYTTTGHTQISIAKKIHGRWTGGEDLLVQNLSYRSGAEPPATVLPKVILKLPKKWVSCLHAGKSQFCPKGFATLYGSAARVFFFCTVVPKRVCHTLWKCSARFKQVTHFHSKQELVLKCFLILLCPKRSCTFATPSR